MGKHKAALLGRTTTMKVYALTQDNPEGIDRYQLFATKELADKVAALWVDHDNEQRQEMLLDEDRRDEWRYIKEHGYWGFGTPEDDGSFHPVYTICVSEVEVHETVPKM